MTFAQSKIDLHSHTCHSDGVETPTELVLKAAQEGIRSLAITDHDTVAALSEALARIDEARGGRERTLDVLKIEREKTGDICADLIKRAGVKTGKTGVEGKWNWIRQAPGN